MEVKGTAIKTIPEFVKEKFPEEYSRWFNALPDGSKTIFNEKISSSKWYPIKEALILPTRLIGEMFYEDIEKGAFELGIFSSESAIKGIYRMLVQISSPSFVVNRTSGIMSSYYRPCIMDVTKSSKKMAVLSIIDFPESDVVVDYRVLGWIKTTFEFSKFNSPKVTLLKSMGKGDFSTDYLVEWV
ncbi:MAG: hypothetical protein JXR51_02340 [Bacteroidales bacterium]|nr:hypothetical protein [Bacteroidales bacterium]